MAGDIWREDALGAFSGHDRTYEDLIYGDQ
jgi:hypothetical protein